MATPFNYTPSKTPASAGGATPFNMNAPAKPQLGMLPNPQDPVTQAASNTMNDYSQAVPNFMNASQSGQSKNPIVKAGEGALAATASGINTIFSPITNAVKSASDSFAQNAKDPLNPKQPLTSNPVVSKLLDFFGNASGGLDKWVQAHPEAAQNLNNAITVGTTALAGGEKGLDKPIGTVKGIVEAPAKASEGIINSADAVKNKVSNTLESRGLAKDTQKIQEMISPKPTVKQAKIAQTEGRLVQGKEPTLFKAGTEDKILPTKKSVEATDLIQKSIPGASKMSEGELYKAVDENISNTAKKLRPQMEQTPIKPETIQKINDDWTELKKSQMEEAPATEEANVAKRQAKFESLLQKSGSGNHADLWDTAINYDNSIPEAVKKANSLSSESLQLQKEEWLQNRKILGDAIGKTNIPEFKQMASMYEAKNGLLSKAKVNGARMSRVNEFLKRNPNLARFFGGVTMYEIAKHVGLPLP
jgi:hypothetical protein